MLFFSCGRRCQICCKCCRLVFLLLICQWFIILLILIAEFHKGHNELSPRRRGRTRPQLYWKGNGGFQKLKTALNKQESDSFVVQKSDLKCTLESSLSSHESDSNGYVASTPAAGYAGAFFRRANATKTSANRLGSLGSGWTTGCVISKKYKFIYIHVLKSGGTTVKLFLKKGLCAGDPDTIPAGAKCPQGDNDAFAMAPSCAKALRDNPDFFVWSFVRNPFSRMFSAYSMAIGAYKKPGVDEVPFGKYVLEGSKYQQSVSKMSPSHFNAQQQFLFDRNQCPAFDFLGRLEHFDHDLEIVVKTINSPDLTKYFESFGGKIMQKNAWGHHSKGSKTLKSKYESDQIVQAVAHKFPLDFKLLGYDNKIVPET